MRTDVDVAAVLAKIESPNIVLIGAWNDIKATIHPGGHTLTELPDQPNYNLWCIDPLPWCISNIKEIAKGDPRIRTLQFAVGDHDGEATFNVFSPDMCSSLRRQVGGGAPYSQLSVEVKRLDTLLAAGLLPDHVDYVTLDVQGCSLEAIRGGREFFSMCRMAWVEAEFSPLYDGESLWPEIRDAMLSLGFRQATEMTEAEMNTDWEDVLFVRGDL